MNKYFLLSLILISFFVPFLEAESATNRFYIFGKAVQGNMLYGRTTPGSKVFIGNKSIPVSKKGEFIFGISRDSVGDLKVKVKFPNGTEDTRTLLIKENKWNIQKINALPKKQVDPSKEDLEIIRSQAKEVKQAREISSKPSLFPGCFIQPIEGKISSIYGSQRILNGVPKSPHLGLDIAAKEGTPIKASGSGTVTYAVTDNFYNGQMVIIDHGYGISTSYSHMSKINVKVGDKVKKGSIIGLVGSSGRSTGPHLHWGVTWFNTPLNPTNVLKVSSRRCSLGKGKRVTKDQ